MNEDLHLLDFASVVGLKLREIKLEHSEYQALKE